MEHGEIYSACCMPEEQPRIYDLPKCIHSTVEEEHVIDDAVTSKVHIAGDGIDITTVTYLQTESESGKEGATEKIEEIDVSIEDSNDEVTVAIETIIHDSEIDDEHENNDKETVSCCSMTSTMHSLRSPNSQQLVCPKDMHTVQGFSANLVLLDGANANIQVCCDAITQAGDVNTGNINPCQTSVPKNAYAVGIVALLLLFVVVRAVF